MSASKNRIYYLLQRAAHCLKTEADAVLTQAGGLTTAQAAVMLIIAEDGPATQRHVAETLSQRESAITAMATRLLKAGYITKRRSPKDARAWELEVTEKGRLAITKLRQPFEDINAKLDAQIDGDEMRELATALAKVIEVFDN